MRLALVALLTALPCVAQDAGAGTPDVPIVVRAGHLAPVDGLLLPADVAISSAKRLAACEAEVPALREAVRQTSPWWVVPVVAVVALGVGVGVGLTVRH